jgi:hypothetical protein
LPASSGRGAKTLLVGKETEVQGPKWPEAGRSQ